ncbi:TetR/AcrR family transcriptional regulator [Kitasatospora sp. NPDC097691]|uniref:TetR/AcrR family transcriptional regulator n=1 Tax=Kitasatospora sp. NPDC097691 TaxID=3157231 RepID=UPI00331BE5CC
MDTTRSNRDQMLDAAESLFSSRGYADVTIVQVCQASGLPVGSIYHHFTNKFGLLAAVVDRASTRFFDGLPVVEELRDADPLDRLGAYYDRAAEVMGDQAPFMRLMFLLQLQEDKDGKIAPLVREARRRVRDELTAAIEPVARDCGAPDATELAKELAELTVSFTAGLVAFTESGTSGVATGMRRLRQFVLTAIKESVTGRSVTAP